MGSMLALLWGKWRRLRRMPKPVAARSSAWCCRCWHDLLSLLLVLVMVLQPPGLRIGGAVAGEDTHSSSRRRFRDPKATFYDLLGVSRHSSQKEIKRAFKKLAIQMHPDKLGPFENEESESNANTIFIKVRIGIVGVVHVLCVVPAQQCLQFTSHCECPILAEPISYCTGSRLQTSCVLHTSVLTAVVAADFACMPPRAYFRHRLYCLHKVEV